MEKIKKLTEHEMKTWSYSQGFPTHTNYERPITALKKKMDEIIDVINKARKEE